MQVNPGYNVLMEAISIKSSAIKSRSKDGLILECEIRRLQSRFLGLPSHLAPSQRKDSLEEWGVMGLMAKGTRCVTGLVCSLLGWWILYKNKTTDNIVDTKSMYHVFCLGQIKVCFLRFKVPYSTY